MSARLLLFSLILIAAAPAARAADDPWRDHALGLAYLDENAVPKAAEHLGRAGAALPTSTAVAHDEAVAWLRHARHAEAGRALDRLERLAGAETPSALYMRGLIAKREERFADAARLLERASGIAEDPYAAFHAGVAYRRLDQPAKARMLLEIAVTRDPRFASAWYQLSTLARQQGDEKRAAAAMAAFERERKTTPLEEMTPEALERGNLARPRAFDPEPGIALPPPIQAESDTALADYDNDGDLELPTALGLPTASALPIDLDLDGWIDVVALDSPARLYRNVSGTAFVLVPDGQVLAAGARAGKLVPGGFLLESGGAVHDFRRRAAPPAIEFAEIVKPRRGPMIRPRRGPRPPGALAVRLVGAYSNKQGLGATVEVRAGAARAWALVDGPTPIYFDLEGRRADTLRIVWPNGTVQAVVDPAPGEGDVVTVTEKGRQKTSCPLIFAWDGERFRFVTDALGAAFIGILVAPPDRYYQPDPDEVVRIPPGALVARDGRLLLRVAEQLEEVTYLDRARLLAVDHDEGTEAYPHEQLRLGPPWPEFFVCDARGARDVPFRREPPLEPLRFTGFTRPWALEVELGDVRSAPHAHLLVDGWLRYWNSTSAYEAARNGVAFEAPRLDIRKGGAWREAMADPGMPAGLPKTMVLDLTRAVAGGDAPAAVRIRSNQEVHVDRVRLCTAHGARPPVVTALAPAEAELARIGYFRVRHRAGGGRQPVEYIHDERDEVGFLGRLAGRYTRFGDVRPLALEADDRFVVFGHGEEVALAFDAAALPPLAAGRTRTFFLELEGYCKEMDPHTAHARTVEPLPYHGMKSYPYAPGDAFPADEAHRRYLEEWQTREDPGSGAVMTRD